MLKLLATVNRISAIAVVLAVALQAVGALLYRQKEADELPLAYLTSTPSPYKTVTKSDLEDLQKTVLQVKPVTIPFYMPDLRSEILYLGKNERPDAESQQILYLSLKGSSDPLSVPAGSRLYLTRQASNKWQLSPCNKPSPLWIEAQSVNEGVKISAQLHSPSSAGPSCAKADAASSFKELSEFVLPEQPTQNAAAAVPEIGKFRMDSSLLARQRARWIGPDRFLEDHGGEEYAECWGKERIEFGEGDSLYALYVKEHDAFIWENQQWVKTLLGPESRNHFLLLVKKIEDRLMHFTLFDTQGRLKVNLTLIKPIDPPFLSRVVEEFHYVGARSLKQWLFELRGKRVSIKSGDWWLLMENEWQLLKTPASIDEYVARKKIGLLFIVDGLQKKAGQICFCGKLYNMSRTQVERVCVPIHKGDAPNNAGRDRRQMMEPKAPEEEEWRMGEKEERHLPKIKPKNEEAS